MPSIERQHLGRRGETLAAEHFERLGYEVLARNHRTRFGELDLVLCDGRVLVFCEVKARRLGSGAPWDKLDEASGRRCAGWRAPGSPTSPTARAARSCGSTPSG
jgi:putative endonuclease